MLDKSDNTFNAQRSGFHHTFPYACALIAGFYYIFPYAVLVFNLKQQSLTDPFFWFDYHINRRI